MPFIPVNLNEIEEQKPVAKGEYELQITGCQEAQTGENSKHPGAPMLRFSLGFTDLDLNAPNISHFVSLPFDGDENASFKLLMLKRFLVAFGIPFDDGGIDTEQLAVNSAGCTTTIEVDQVERDGNIYNTIKIPRLREEPAGRKHHR